jgi:hypothetical protein
MAETETKTPLTAGLTVVINKKVGATNTPIYPVTKVENVKAADGTTLTEIVAGLAPKEHGNHVPDYSKETASSIRFLRNDNTWATIQSASTEAPGIVQLSNDTALDDGTVAATAKAVKTIADQVKANATASDSTYTKKSQLGVATKDGVTGIATLDENGTVPASQLPSYVDDVVDVKMGADLKSATLADGSNVKPESGKIYVDDLGDSATNKTYRWSGTTYVVISETLALGETSSTAFDGARGKVAYDHSQAPHARVDATKVESSATNGYIKINGTETLVYAHPSVSGATATNPHGTTKDDVGLGKAENLTGTELVDNYVTNTVITNKLGYTPQDKAVLATAANNGVMSKEYAAKLDNTMEMAVSPTEPTFSTGNGLWLQVVE